MFGFIAASFSKEKKLYKAVKNILGFYPGNIFLYRLAFRHKSASRVSGGIKSNNERLEYLGDSVISTAVAHYLFMRYPNKDEGFLTEMRSKMVSRATLNKVAQKMGLHELLNIDVKAGGFKSVDGNALEALMGAVFLDKGYRFTEKVILKRVVAVHIDMDEIEKRDWNYKSKLIDWGQKERYKVNFQVQGTMNQKGKRLYKVAAMVEEEVWGEGIDQSIKAAEQIAAENAYKNKVLLLMEKQSKQGYREPLGDEKKTLGEKSGPGVDVVESQEVLPLKTIRHQDTEDACKEDTSVVPVHQKMMVLQPEGLSGTANTISVALGLGEAGMHEPVPMEGSGHAGTSVTSASDDSVSSGEERD